MTLAHISPPDSSNEPPICSSVPFAQSVDRILSGRAVSEFMSQKLD
jgi:hypothetical protein